MVEPRRPTSDPAGIDQNDTESFRAGFPHEAFTRRRRVRLA